MDCYADRQSFITLKDHKDNFKSSTKCRLIKPAKSEMGKVSKSYLETIISDANKTPKHSNTTSGKILLLWLSGSNVFRIKETVGLLNLVLLNAAHQFLQIYKINQSIFQNFLMTLRTV